MDIVKVKLLEILFRVVNRSFLMSIQSLFKLRRGHYNLRGLLWFETSKIRTNAKQRCVSVVGVKLWNDLSDQFKLISTLSKFKKSLKCETINTYQLCH